MFISNLSKAIIYSKSQRPSHFITNLHGWLACSHSSVLNDKKYELFKEKQLFQSFISYPIHTLSPKTIGNSRIVHNRKETTFSQKKWKNTNTIEDDNESITSDLSLNDQKWYEMLNKLSYYYKEHQHSNVTTYHPTLSTWIKRQRKMYKKNKMPPHRIQALKGLKFQFDVHGVSWESMRKKLQEYKDREGHVNVPKDHPILGHWVATQRHNFKFDRGRLTRKRMERLQEMGFIFDVLEHTWQLMYKQIKEYMEKYGDCNVPATYEENRALSKWVSTQRSNYKSWMENPDTCYFPKHRIDALDDIGFSWDYFESVWLDKYNELKQYEAYNGHCNVPFHYESNPPLGIWVSTQRQQYGLFKKGKPSKLTVDRMKKLEDLGFIWDIRAAQWQEKYEELTKFIQMNGHSYVPIANKPLGPWVSTQRYQYSLWEKGKQSRLTEERRKKLDEIGFNRKSS